MSYVVLGFHAVQNFVKQRFEVAQEEDHTAEQYMFEGMGDMHRL